MSLLKHFLSPSKVTKMTSPDLLQPYSAQKSKNNTRGVVTPRYSGSQRQNTETKAQGKIKASENNAKKDLDEKMHSEKQLSAVDKANNIDLEQELSSDEESLLIQEDNSSIPTFFRFEMSQDEWSSAVTQWNNYISNYHNLDECLISELFLE